MVSTFAGNGWKGLSSSEGVPRLQAMFDNPEHLACDGVGNVYVVDAGNNAVRKISDKGNINDAIILARPLTSHRFRLDDIVT